MADHVWLCSTCVHPEDNQHYVGFVARDGICARCFTLAQEVYLTEAQEVRQAQGTYHLPRVFSTSTALATTKQIIWDVNRYYRDLGVPTDATRKQIRLAYQQAQGWESTRLTYIVRQLLNPKIRDAYDRCRPGTIFFDRYWKEYVEAEIQKDLSQRLGTDGSQFEARAEKIQLPPEDEPFEVVDRDDGYGQTGPTPIWSWGYFLWQSGCRDIARLAGWQEQLVRAFAERGEIRQIGVGFLGAHMRRPWEVKEVGYLTVVFLADNEQPSADLAIEAADRVTTT